MATHHTDVSGRSPAPGIADAADASLTRVPDVQLRSEIVAVAAIKRSGLVPGRRSPRPRPASGRNEVVFRTHPRRGSLVPRGTRVDYDLVPGEPRQTSTWPSGYVDHDAASTLNSGALARSVGTSGDVTVVSAAGYVDYDMTDSVVRPSAPPRTR